ncbi:hypothetical protein IE53DRAFT_195938 [Violaceomyces palustris]|uniref:Uncharacterized protein n=1 Tax=Violaceomyces palustris TaxID=1673888 RepID=A0ACD0NRV6_9BASI|nr:hypothetical protein IE53DRAFT_195938 [Violaceomyces palustris]
MSPTFDFDAFISSPTQGDTLNPVNQSNSSNAGNNFSGNDMIVSFSDSGMASTSAQMAFMGGASLGQGEQMLYGTFGDPMGGDIIDSWNFGGGEGTQAPSVNGFDAMVSNNASTHPILAPPAMKEAGGVNPEAKKPIDLRSQAAANYRSSIAAHHSQFLASAPVRNAANLIPKGIAQVGPLAAGQAGGRPGPALPRGQTSKKGDGKSGKHSAASLAFKAMTLQERRRLLRNAHKQAGMVPTPSASSSDANEVGIISSRGTKRGIDSDDGAFSSSGQDNTTSGPGTSGNESSGPSKPSVQPSHEEVEPAPSAPGTSAHGQITTGPVEDEFISNRYSISGLDILGILSRAITRPSPRISLGPVDLSCSFTISDARHPDQPLVYVSDTFCHLTGYTSQEILGRNCRFLQAPGIAVEEGGERLHTDSRAVEHLKRHLSSNNECQASLINYRKDGQPFINLVTVVPVSWSNPPEVDFLVGFQVDLVEQPGAILERKDDGSYVVNYRSINDPPPSAILPADELTKEADLEASKQAAMAQDISDLISGKGPSDAKQWSRLLLENSHDLIYVLSLKGTFLYVSPSVERILGFRPDEIIGKSISEFCHPSDVVPVFRELKDSTSNASIAAAASRTLRTEGVAKPMTKGGGGQAGPRVNLILRMRHKVDGYKWIESTGKLHLEQGKGRKVVISSGRPRPVYNLAWDNVRHSAEVPEPSFWSKLSIDGIFLSCTGPVWEVLGCDSKDLFGRHIVEASGPEAAPAILQALRSRDASAINHKLDDGSGNGVQVFSTFYPSPAAGGPALPTVFVHTQKATAEMSWMIPNVVYPKIKARQGYGDGINGPDSLSSVFAELSTYRGSSWVFEMHQLKNVNRRLKDEIRALRRQSKDSASTSHPTIAFAPQSPVSMRAGHSQGFPQAPGVQSPGKKRPDHGHGHRQHLRPSKGPAIDPNGSSSGERSATSSNELTSFDSYGRSGSASDETAITTANSSGETSEKDSLSDSRRGSRNASGSEEVSS